MTVHFWENVLSFSSQRPETFPLITGLLSGNLGLLEFDGVQNLLEFLARVGTGQKAFDTAAAHVCGGLCALGSASQPEIAEIAQLCGLL